MTHKQIEKKDERNLLSFMWNYRKHVNIIFSNYPNWDSSLHTSSKRCALDPKGLKIFINVEDRRRGVCWNSGQYKLAWMYNSARMPELTPVVRSSKMVWNDQMQLNDSEFKTIHRKKPIAWITSTWERVCVLEYTKWK